MVNQMLKYHTLSHVLTEFRKYFMTEDMDSAWLLTLSDAQVHPFVVKRTLSGLMIGSQCPMMNNGAGGDETDHH